MTLHVIVTGFNRVIQLRRMIDCFIIQTNPNWQLHIIHDGPAPKEAKFIVSTYKDERIHFEETEKINGAWGHPNRSYMLRKMVLNHYDYVLITNDDNDYVPVFVEKMLKKAKGNAGMVYCDAVHSYLDYEILKSRIQENYIDMGSFIVRVDVAKKVGFTDRHYSADGSFAVKCAEYCNYRRLSVIYIPKALFVHN